MTRRTATSIGFTAILLWSLLALFTAASGAVPPFQLSAMTFLIGGLVGVAGWVAGPLGLRALAQTPVVWVLGVGGLFGYHALYFASLRLAPPAEAGLVNYLWPLLIVLFSSFLPGVRPAVASRRRAPRLRRGRRPHRGARGARGAGGALARICLRVRGRLRVVRLFRPVAAGDGDAVAGSVARRPPGLPLVISPRRRCGRPLAASGSRSLRSASVRSARPSTCGTSE